MKSRQDGFTLTELLIVVAVIGILATIAVPNLLTAVERGKQKRSMADMRQLAASIESYGIDNNFYPVQAGLGSIEGITSAIVPYHIQALHVTDGWANHFEYVTDSAASEYTIYSYGKDGVPSGPTSGPTTSFADDIIYSSGAFIAYPEGVQVE